MNNNMLPLEFNNNNMAEKSCAHLSLLDALGVKNGDDSSPQLAARAALAEAIAFPDHGEKTLGQMLSLSEKVLFYRDDTFPHESVIYDVDSLCERVGISRRMGQIVVRLCGAWRQPCGGRFADDTDAQTVLLFDDFDGCE